MNRIQTACYCLLTSAFILAAILVLRIDATTPDNTADANMVVNQPQFSLMTARTRGTEESLFVLDSNNGKVVVYAPNLSRERLEVVVGIDLAQDVFGGNGNGGGNSR